MKSRKRVVESAITAIEISQFVTRDHPEEMVDLVDKLSEDDSFNAKRPGFLAKLIEQATDGMEALTLLLCEDYEVDEARSRVTELFAPFFKELHSDGPRPSSEIVFRDTTLDRVDAYLRRDEDD